MITSIIQKYQFSCFTDSTWLSASIADTRPLTSVQQQALHIQLALNVWTCLIGSLPVWRTSIPNNTGTYLASVPEWSTCHRKVWCCAEETYPKGTLGTQQRWCYSAG